MKFLLVALNAKYIHSNPALYSLRGSVDKERQKQVEIGEYTINHSFTEILADIYRRKPQVIGFSCYIWNISMVLELATELKKLLPRLPIWLGGPEVTYDAPRLLETYPMLTGIMVGEGEETFRELLEHYVNQSGEEKLKQIRGLCLPGGFTAPRELTDMSRLPFLYDDLAAFQNRIIYYESARGCPFRCSYCLSSIDKAVRLRDLDTVKKELQFFLDHKVKQVKFVDRTFNCNHKHAMGIWEYLLEHDNGVTNFHFEVSADLLNAEEIHLLNRMRPGLVQLEIGVQSTNLQTLEAIHRRMDVEKLERIVEAVRVGNNVHQHLDLIAGLPYEDYESFGRSFDRVYAMKPQQLQLGFLKVLKGSEMHERAQEHGICYLDKPPYEVLYTKWLSFEEVLRLKRIEEMVELYYNSNQFIHTMAFLEQAFSSPFAMYGELADFFEERGYFVNSPARSYRYQVLLEFATQKDALYQAVYRELLTYDMYLREKLKTRPGFACDIQTFKEEARRFYRGEESERRYLPDYEEFDAGQMARMTHLEPFHYPVWNMPHRAMLKRSEQPVYILFDYRKRNPLTQEAHTTEVAV